jgi:penicillin G amidase
MTLNISELGIAAVAAARLLRPRSERISTAQRLAMLPARNAPIRHPVSIHWDDHQVPYIEAETDDDLAVALGIVHAHLRLAQIEVLRRVAFGRVAEMIGQRGVSLDLSLRMLEFAHAVPEIIERLPAPTRNWAECFVRGLNHVILHSRKLPREFAVLGIKREPWTLVDLFTLARLAASDVSWFVWPKLLRSREAMTPEQWQALWPRLLAGGAATSLAVDQPLPGAADEEVAVRTIAAYSRQGSNSAAVSSRRSATGSAMIASDPHLPLHMPPPWLIVGFTSPGYQATGLMLAGLPFFGLGRNKWIAWGGTSLQAPSTELFDITSLAPSEIVTRTETLRIRGARSKRVQLSSTRYGPVITGGMYNYGSKPIGVRWVGHRPSDELTAYLSLLRAHDWRAFRDAMQGAAVPALNMIYADASGRVGHMVAAHLPKHAPGPHEIVRLASDARWDEFITGADLPAQLDPPEEFVASANNRPASEIAMGLMYSPDDRAQRMRELLGRAPPVSLADLERMQRDVMMPSALDLRDRLLTHLQGVQKRTPADTRALQALEQWDGSYAPQSRGALVFELTVGHLAAALIAHHELTVYFALWTARPLLAERIAETPGHILGPAVRQAFARAAHASTRYKNWGDVHRLFVGHSFGLLPVVGRRYVLGRFPAGGSNDTLCKSTHGLVLGRHDVRLGVTARHISDMADDDANYFVLFGGQDGWLGSANFYDQVQLLQRGEYVQVPLRPETARRVFKHKTVLRPDGAGNGAG